MSMELAFSLMLMSEPSPAASPVPVPQASSTTSGSTTPATATTANPLVAQERDGPPFHTEEDLQLVRQRHRLEVNPPNPPGRTVWRCLVADPRCGFTIEVNAMTAYALRFRQGAVNRDEVLRWNSVRTQFDVWLNIPALTETRGWTRYTRMSLGPKGGVIVSDGGQIWGNLGFATRYWFGRGPWALALEFSTGLTFGLVARKRDPDDPDVQLRMHRTPMGIHTDVGLNVGGWGAIVVGAQYDSPLAREDIPDEIKVSSSGMFYVGFRGNILWGAPAAAAVGGTALAQRVVTAP